MADRKKSRDRGRERPVTGRCVACSEGHCWSYERTMHCPRPEYSPYQLTSHYQHSCPITIPAALTHTHTCTHTPCFPPCFNHKFGLTRLKPGWCITEHSGDKPGGRPAAPDKRLKSRHAWAHTLCRLCVCVCACTCVIYSKLSLDPRTISAAAATQREATHTSHLLIISGSLKKVLNVLGVDRRAEFCVV